MLDCSSYVSFSDFSQTHTFWEALQCFFMRAPMDASALAPSLWWIIALPIVGSLLSGLFGKTLGRDNTGFIASAAVAGSFILSLLVFWTINDFQTTTASAFSPDVMRYAVGHDFGTWFSAGAFRANFGLSVDHLSGIMLLVITGVGLLIHIYSTEYMSHDDGYWRFFAYLNLFVAMMLVLVMADSLVLLFVGWEGVGMCSYLLIGFWYTDSQKAFAGRKAFVTNRIGDFGFLLGMFVLVLMLGAFGRQATVENFDQRGQGPSMGLMNRFKAGLSEKGPLSFQGLEAFANSMKVKAVEGSNAVSLETPISEGPLAGYTFGQALTGVLLLFLLGAAGKSAQLPLYVWLPDAMAGPTPVSALIHAATMVTAGVYLFCRLSYLVVLSPFAMATIAIVGALTALLAALIAFAQDDLKKVLAYSTVSQLGFMFMAVGMGVFWAGFLHVVTHAFFKACLFLGAGSVMHGNADEGNIKKLGGLRHEMKWTWATFTLATLAITGIVPLSGFFSKDGILHGIHSTTLMAYPWVTNVVWGLGLMTAAFTAFYMTRLYLLTFEGTRAKDARIAHAHESAARMTGPLVVLAFLSVVFLVQGIPFMRTEGSSAKQTIMENFLAPVFRSANNIIENGGLMTVHPTESIPWGAWGMAWAIALVGGGVAVFMYTRFFPGWGTKPVPAFALAARQVAAGKFFVDELYEKVIIKPLTGVSKLLFKLVDSFFIDTLVVRGTAWVTQATGSWLRYFQTGDTQSYAAAMAVALAAGIAYVVFKVIQ